MEDTNIAKLIKPNESFTYPEVRLIGAEGEQIGIVSYAQARQRAVDAKMDLVLVADKSTPPVCRVMDFGKLVFEQKKNLKAQRKSNVTQKLKEIQFHANIDTHDYQVKLNRGIEFLEKGNKLKVVLSFRGREMQHQEIGFQLITKVLEDLKLYGSTEDQPKLAGRMIVIHVTPLRAGKGRTKPQTTYEGEVDESAQLSEAEVDELKETE